VGNTYWTQSVHGQSIPTSAMIPMALLQQVSLSGRIWHWTACSRLAQDAPFPFPSPYHPLEGCNFEGSYVTAPSTDKQLVKLHPLRAWRRGMARALACILWDSCSIHCQHYNPTSSKPAGDLAGEYSSLHSCNHKAEHAPSRHMCSFGLQAACWEHALNLAEQHTAGDKFCLC